MFSLKTQSRLKLLQGHDKNVSVVKFSSDATTVVSGSFDNNIIIWDWVEKEYTPKVLKGHEGLVTALALTADGGRIFFRFSRWDSEDVGPGCRRAMS